jgi:hypothetical protein
LGKTVFDKEIPVSLLITRYNLSKSVLYKYANTYASGHEFFGNGCPKLISEVEEGLLLVKLKDHENFKLRTPEFKSIIYDGCKSTAVVRGKSDEEVICASDTSIWRIERRLGIKTGFAEVITDARLLATMDIRNCVSFAAMNGYMVPKVNSRLILNCDATQFHVGYNTTEKKVEVKYIGERCSSKPLKTTTTEGDKGSGVGFFIKYFLLISAFGNQSHPVFVIADSCMDPEAIDIHEVEGLGVGTDITATGYVVFCRTRCGNTAFFEWYTRTILVGVVVATKERYHKQLNPESLAWYQLDGEPIQIKVFEDKDVLAMLNAHSIVVGKPPASTTAITQPCDSGNCFRGPKTTNKRLNDADVSHNAEMLDTLSVMVNKHVSNVSPHCDDPTMSAAHRHMAVYGLLRIQLALMTSMHRCTITKSFEKTGIFPYNVANMFKECKTTISPEEAAHIHMQLPDLIETIAERGELTDEDFERCNIRALGASKDQLVVYRRRSVILTNRALIAREDDKRAAKGTNADAPVVKRGLPKRTKRPDNDDQTDASPTEETPNKKRKKKALKGGDVVRVADGVSGQLGQTFV